MKIKVSETKKLVEQAIDLMHPSQAKKGLELFLDSICDFSDDHELELHDVFALIADDTVAAEPFSQLEIDALTK